jgi:hypothetical protein
MGNLLVDFLKETGQDPQLSLKKIEVESVVPLGGKVALPWPDCLGLSPLL